MNNITITSQKLSETTQTSKNKELIQLSVAVALERTNSPALKVDSLVNDILEEFKNYDIDQITKAIRNGSLGLYGRTYRMSTQEVCIWIREYLKTNKIPVKKFNGNAYLKRDPNVTTI